MNIIEIVPLTEEQREEMGEPNHVELIIAKFGDGFIFTYQGCWSNPGWYGRTAETPFQTIEEAKSVGLDFNEDSNVQCDELSFYPG